MPELPEAETVRRQLEPRIVGQTIQTAWARLPRRTFPSIDAFIAQIQGSTIVAAKRRGKQIYFPLDNDLNFLVHLGMTGRLEVQEGSATASLDPATLHKHIHAVLHFQSGNALVFTDPRTFGSVGVSGDLPFITAMGPEPIDDDFDEAAMVASLKKRKTKIKAALLDQKIVAGLGNIYADEVCFLAGVHPATPACDVPLKRLQELVSHMKPVLERAIAARGATLKDNGYQDIFGIYGEYHPLAYGRTGEPCHNCARPIQRGVLGTGKSARSFHFCPRCQPLKR